MSLDTALAASPRPFARIMIVEDDPGDVYLLEKALRGRQIRSPVCPQENAAIFPRNRRPNRQCRA